MAAIKEIIELVDECKPNAFSSRVKLAWIAELDGRLALDVFLMDVSETQQFAYRVTEDLDKEPLVRFPHDDIYRWWLEAKIDYQNGEYSKYQNSMEMYNAAYGDFVRWFAAVYRPAQGGGLNGRSNLPVYYITAYGLAVKQGFRGSLDEWLADLKGREIELGVEDGVIRWRYIPQTVLGVVQPEPWRELADLKDVIYTLEEAYGSHVVSRNNPHKVTAEQVGSAPAGYGLGSVTGKVVLSLTELDSAIRNGWYGFKCTNTSLCGVQFNEANVFVYSYEGFKHQEIRPAHTNYVLKRVHNGATWDDWEIDNPPLMPEVEYRTTERYQGRVVYAKLVDCGTLPNASSKYIQGVLPSDVVVFRLFCDVQLTAPTGESVYYEHLAVPNSSISIWTATNSALPGNLGILTTTDRSGYTAKVTVFYTRD